MVNVDKIYDDIIKTGFYKSLEISKMNLNKVDVEKLFTIICLEFKIQTIKYYYKYDKFYLIYRDIFNVLKDDGFDYLELYECSLRNIIDTVKPDFIKLFKDDVRKNKLEKIFLSEK